MTFEYQLNNIFNQRLPGLSENDRNALNKRHRMLVRSHNALQQFGQNNNIALRVTVTDGYEIPEGLSFPLAVVLASSQFHLDLDDIFTLRLGEHPVNREGDPVDWREIQHLFNIAHNRLVLRRKGGEGVSIMVTAVDMDIASTPSGLIL